eukprot:122489-Chlamydomonas_euryale.AAC.1
MRLLGWVQLLGDFDVLVDPSIRWPDLARNARVAVMGPGNRLGGGNEEGGLNSGRPFLRLPDITPNA